MQYREYGDVQMVMNVPVLVFPGLERRVQRSWVVTARIWVGYLLSTVQTCYSMVHWVLYQFVRILCCSQKIIWSISFCLSCWC